VGSVYLGLADETRRIAEDLEEARHQVTGTSAASARASGRGRVAATPAAQPAKAADAARALELRRPARSAAQILGRQAYAPGWGALRAVFSCLAHHVRA
jgi:hypothetical protein